MLKKQDIVFKQIKVSGLVQGVGFRPFIYRIATKYHLQGWVKNTNEGVLIKLAGTEDIIADFIQAIQIKAPIIATIDKLVIENSKAEELSGFNIIESQNDSSQITKVSPDIAVCSDCLEELRSMPRRIDYPFINCTNCGPRFSIIKELPYDRPKTTMADFIMCQDCEREYADIHNRRFHAQPNACEICGPKYYLLIDNKRVDDFSEITKQITTLIRAGKILGIKGLGGMNLVCDATNNVAVDRLRHLKDRESKPFAVMFPDIKSIKQYAYVSKKEEKILMHYSRPIVLLKMKKELCQSVTNGLDTIGAILPYMPLHYLMFKNISDPIILTSGNMKNEPIIISDKEAVEKLGSITDGLLLYNREIYNRNDDSVMFVANDQSIFIRRSRGFAPNMINLNMNVEGIVATGAEQKNTFCLGRGTHAIPSQFIGDIKNVETYNFFTESIDRFSQLFRVMPTLYVYDKHPDYLSSQYAKSQGINSIAVQHHVAHVASCMAEHNLDETVIGVSFDGTGYGDDGKIWGGEFFVMDFVDYKRVYHIDYIEMPGGEKAIYEPWRMAIAYLYKAFGNSYLGKSIPIMSHININKIETLHKMIDNGINCPMTSSVGRIFDAISAIIGLCVNSKFEAEAPMRLESIIAKNNTNNYEIQIDERTINILPMIREIVLDLEAGVGNNEISAKFHNTMVVMIAEIVENISKETGIKKVVLSGGIFQNRYLLENAEQSLIDRNISVYSHRLVPTNDGGISLGQLAIGAKLRR